MYSRIIISIEFLWWWRRSIHLRDFSCLQPGFFNVTCCNKISLLISTSFNSQEERRRNIFVCRNKFYFPVCSMMMRWNKSWTKSWQVKSNFILSAFLWNTKLRSFLFKSSFSWRKNNVKKIISKKEFISNSKL